MSTRKTAGKCFLKTGSARMLEVSKRTFNTFFPWSTEAVGASCHLRLAGTCPRPAKSGIGAVKGNNMNETSSSGSAAVPAPS